jgi:hypothetical protein
MAKLQVKLWQKAPSVAWHKGDLERERGTKAGVYE